MSSDSDSSANDLLMAARDARLRFEGQLSGDVNRTHTASRSGSAIHADPEGSAIDVGDSRSIVLALRSLQDKIRKLESDRDFHRSQCEAARRAHEEYKADVEDQLHRDRAEFRRRESELQDLIARAQQEQSRLVKLLETTRGDAGDTAASHDSLLAREREAAAARERRLKEELETYRTQLAEERLELERLRQGADQARAERDVLAQANRRLEHSVHDLLSVNQRILGGPGEKPRDGSSVHVAQRTGRPRASSQIGDRSIMQPPMRFQSPTLSSAHHRATSHKRDVVNLRRNSGAPQSVNVSSVTNKTLSAAAQPLDAVYESLEAELKALNQQYRKAVESANLPNSSERPEALTAKLNSLMTQIDRKSEQLRLVRNTRASAAAEEARRRPVSAKGTEKVTAQHKHMNTLRRMAAFGAN